ncbi:hypothetical protein K7432_014224 [Basidiobolus ranarum]|uniref:DH domain-containing protein n=1 Tax=Basidiobolus ranarum TaxID=34480 RepID=A0ABR2WHX7_9FUNG
MNKNTTQHGTRIQSSRSSIDSTSETESEISVNSDRNTSDCHKHHAKPLLGSEKQMIRNSSSEASQTIPFTDSYKQEVLKKESAHKKDIDHRSKSSHFHPRYNLRSLHLFKTRKSSPSILNHSDSASSQTDSETAVYSETDTLKKSSWGVLDFFDASHTQAKKKSSPEPSVSQISDSKKDCIFRSPFRRRSLTLDSIHRTFSIDEIQNQLNRAESQESLSEELSTRRNTLEDEVSVNSVPSISISDTIGVTTPDESDSTHSLYEFNHVAESSSYDGTLHRASSQESHQSSRSNSDGVVLIEKCRDIGLIRTDSGGSLDSLSIRSVPTASVSAGEKEPKRSRSLNGNLEKPLENRERERDRALRKNTSSLDLAASNSHVKAANPSHPDRSSSKTFTASKHLNSGIRPVFNEGRFYVVDEILTTELNYLENLEIILNTFMIPIQKSAKTPHPIIPLRDAKIIFEGIEPLYELSQEICQELKDKVEHWDKDIGIGHLFLHRQKAWETYPRFVDNYSFAREAIRRAEATHSFNSFIKNVARKTTKRQTLKELLIIPIQRVTRYTLLLKDLKKQTKPEHPDYSDVVEALDFMTALAVRVNAVKQREEERTQLFTVFNAVRNCPPTMISAHRRFTLETGVVETRTNRKLHLVLYSDYLMLTTPSKGRPRKPTEKWIFVRLIDLRHIIMFNVPDNKDGTNMTVIFVSNHSFPLERSQSESKPLEGLTVNTQISPATESPPSSPRPRSPLTPQSSLGAGESTKKTKKHIPETSHKYVFQHPDKKSKVDFLIALENELSCIKKLESISVSDENKGVVTPQRTNFIHSFKSTHTNTI